jgi:hypothetical protein
VLGHESDKMARHYAGEGRKLSEADGLFQTYRLRGDPLGSTVRSTGVAPSGQRQPGGLKGRFQVQLLVRLRDQDSNLEPTG